MADFEKHLPTLLKKEGGYVLTNYSTDTGGQTYAGISRRFNPAWEGWTIIDGVEPYNFRKLQELVASLYKKNYWDRVKCNDISSDKIAEILFANAVLTGIKSSSKQIQRICKVGIDGIIGKKTVKAINNLTNTPIKEELLIYKLTLSSIQKYLDIVNRNKAQLPNLIGWINRTLRELH